MRLTIISFTILKSNQISQMLVFGERGKLEYPGKNHSEQGRENQQTQPTYDAESGNRTGDTLVEAHSNEQPDIFYCARSRSKTCPYIPNTNKISGPKRSFHVYLRHCHLLRTLYLVIGETGRRLGERFREYLRDVEKDEKDASKPVAGYFNLPNHVLQTTHGHLLPFPTLRCHGKP